MVSCSLLLLFWVRSKSQEDRISKLATARAAYNISLESAAKFGRCVEIYAMLGGEYSAAFYPIGVSNRRFMEYTSVNPRCLIFEKMHGKELRPEWRLELEPKGNDPKPSGTLRLMLWNDGARVKSKALTRQQSACLNAIKAFACYSDNAMSNSLSANYFGPDGTTHAVDIYHSKFTIDGDVNYMPITQEESLAIGLGPGVWHRPMHGEVEHMVFK